MNAHRSGVPPWLSALFTSVPLSSSSPQLDSSLPWSSDTLTLVFSVPLVAFPSPPVRLPLASHTDIMPRTHILILCAYIVLYLL